MISWNDFYIVLAAMVPLYVAMFIAYGAVQWWKIFTPEQCAGINRYVATIGIPVLSFKIIAFDNLYETNLRFIGADTLQKIVILVILGLWSSVTKKGGLDWSITLFSLSTLPNTVVMGISLLEAMAAKILISQQFPDCAKDIKSVHVDSDVDTLSDAESLQTHVEIDNDGKLHVLVRKTSAGSCRAPSLEKVDGLSSKVSTPRSSNLSGVEIYSIHSSSRVSSLDEFDFRGNNKNGPKEHLRNSYPPRRSNSDLMRSLSNSHEDIVTASRMRSMNNVSNGMSPSKVLPVPQPSFGSCDGRSITPGMGLHMHVWTSTAEGSMHDEGVQNSMEKPVDVADYEVNGSCVSIEKPGINANGGNLEMQRERPPKIVLLRLTLGMIWRKLIRLPNTYACVLGVLWSLTSFKWHINMPSIVKSSIAIIANTGLGMAMFSLGLFMASQPKLIACGKSIAAMAMVTRFLLGPLVIAATSLAIGIRGVLLQVAIMQAALPQGIVPFVYAKEYGLHPGIQSTAVFLSLALGLPVAFVYNIFLHFFK